MDPFNFKIYINLFIQAVIFNEKILTRPSPPAVENMFPLFEKSTLETSFERS